ncbi:MAG: DEAD/DEAH box helicase, partial [Alphaproteobacteria bacterium]|nr:DEAD/DEAH box helicase [Alphaproteobacteria bacterium]
MSLFAQHSDLPPSLQHWFDAKGWQLHDHQAAMINHRLQGQSCLLVAPTGTGKTLAGFLPSLIALDRT